MRVRDCRLTPPPVLAPATSLSAAGRLIERHGVPHAVIVDHRRLVGIISKRAIGAAQPSAATTLTMGEVRGRLTQIAVTDVMTRDPLVVGPTTLLGEAVRLMRDARVNVLVVCEQDGVLGLLTANDLLRVLQSAAAPKRSE